MLLSEIQGNPELAPRLKHSGVIPFGKILIANVLIPCQLAAWGGIGLNALIRWIEGFLLFESTGSQQSGIYNLTFRNENLVAPGQIWWWV